jgi:PEP-CTERM motif-containing protein
MKFQRTTLLKSLSMAIVFAGVLALAQGQARADEVTISGFTTGATSVPQLAFTPNEFISSTFFGIGSLSGTNSLGQFFLNTAPGELVGGIFSLNITFTSPTGIAGSPTTTYTATVLGSVSPIVNQGGVNIDFDNTPQTFIFNDGTNFGSFSLTLVDLFVQSGQNAYLTAGITGQQQTAIPEPATLLLLGAGLTGVAAKMRKRSKEPNEV